MKKFLIAIVLGWIMLFLLQFNTFNSIENSFSDRLTMKTRPVDPRIKIIAIDEESLQRIGEYPLPRGVIADQIDTIASNGAIGIFADFLYTQKSTNPDEDLALAEVVAKHKNIFIPVQFDFSALQKNKQLQDDQYLKLPVIDIPKEQIGHINLLPDEDQVVRKILLGVPTLKEEIIPIINVRLANLLLPADKQITWNDNYVWTRGQEGLPIDESLQVSFTYASLSATSSFEVIPMWKVLEGEISPAYFHGSLVMIGPYAPGLQEQYKAPMSNGLMYGVEVHANMVQALLDNQLYSKASNTIEFLVLVVGVILLYGLFNLTRAKLGALLLAFLIVGYSAFVYFYFQSNLILLPYFYALFAIILAYGAAVLGYYLQERQEKNTVMSTFGRYVSKPAVKDMISRKEDIKLSGIRKDVTVMFVDIRDFTSLLEKMEPEEITSILNRYLDLCTKAVFKYNGTLDKYMGDGVMSIFGAPMVQDDHAQRAIRAALEIRHKSRELAEDLQELLGRSVYLGVGINSGTAIIANVGSENRMDFTAIGDTVNIAAGLESIAKPGQILITSETYERVKEFFECTKLDAIQVKGKEELIEIYEVEWEYDEENDDDEYGEDE